MRSIGRGVRRDGIKKVSKKIDKKIDKKNNQKKYLKVIKKYSWIDLRQQTSWIST